MALNQITEEQKINYYGQFTMIIICFLLMITVTISMLSALLFIFLPALGMWQIIDFVMLWLTYGYKKWYSIYLFALFMIMIGFSFMIWGDTNVGVNLFIIAYTWFLACIYLVMRRMFSV